MVILYYILIFRPNEKLAKFYKKVFDWKIEKFQEPIEYWFIETIPMDEKNTPLEPGINGGIVRRQTPDQRPMTYITGGKITMPKTEMPGMGEYAVALEIEGNPFGLWSIPE